MTQAATIQKSRSRTVSTPAPPASYPSATQHSQGLHIETKRGSDRRPKPVESSPPAVRQPMPGHRGEHDDLPWISPIATTADARPPMGDAKSAASKPAPEIRCRR